MRYTTQEDRSFCHDEESCAPQVISFDSSPDSPEVPSQERQSCLKKPDCCADPQNPDQEDVISSHELGRRGEEAATKFLKTKGYEILERNWKCTAGEVDIIARDDDCLCFIEVKTRSGIQKGFPSDAVDKHKRQRYERIAAYYLRDKYRQNGRVRFDIISIIVLNSNRAFLRLHTNAFGAQ